MGVYSLISVPNMIHVVFRFHDPDLESVIDHEIVPPINDECQLSIEEYRSKLYDVGFLILYINVNIT